MTPAFRELVADADPEDLRLALRPIAAQRLRDNMPSVRRFLVQVVELGRDPIWWRHVMIVMACAEHARVLMRRADELRTKLAAGSAASLAKIKLIDAEAAAYMDIADEHVSRMHTYQIMRDGLPEAERPQWRVEGNRIVTDWDTSDA
jgi:hypothetical protein